MMECAPFRPQPRRNGPISRLCARKEVVSGYEKRAFGLLRKPYWRRIRDSLTTILKPSNSKAFSNYWIDCSTLFVTLSAYRGHLIYTFTHLLFLLFAILKRVIKRWNSNVLAYTFTLYRVVYSMHFLFKSLKPNNSKGYEVCYTCFVPTFTPNPAESDATRYGS
jgi:hypothetical protein